MTACPTSIDIPLFIRQIQAGQPVGAAKTIFDQNILGGMCARVCPTETLCEEACVREAAEGKPVEIGRCSAMRPTLDGRRAPHPYHPRAPDRQARRGGRRRAGGAGLRAPARDEGPRRHRLRRARKAGGLNEYGIAAYKTGTTSPQPRSTWLLRSAASTIETGKALGATSRSTGCATSSTRCSSAWGLAGVNALGVDGDDLDGVSTRSISSPSCARPTDLSKLPVGRASW
jgi:dihydropyrimidine dehydrogenase (NAD+) subunit PreT